MGIAMIWINKEIHVTLLLTVRSRQQGRPSPTAANEFVREGRSLWLPPSPKICPTSGRLSSSFYVMRRPPPEPPPPPPRPSCISHIRLPPKATRTCPCRTCPSKQSKLDCKETKTNVTNRMCACPLSVLGSTPRLTFSQGILSLLRQA